MKSMGPLWLQVGTVAISWLPLMTAASVPFTLKGYDVDGGTDPICWMLTPDNVNSGSFEAKYFEMQPACFNGTDLDITTSDLDQHDDIQIMYIGKPYSFEIEAHANYQVVAAWADPDNDDPGYDDQQQRSTYTLAKNYQEPNYTTIFFRIILCDTRHIGFCSPVTPLSTEIEDNSYTTQTIDEWYKNVSKPGDLDLEAIQVGNHLYSPWLYVQMNEIKPYEFHVRTSITLTLAEASSGTFFVIGHGHICVPVVAVDNVVAEENETVVERDWMDSCVWVEIGDAIHYNVIEAKKAPFIMEVTHAMIVGISVVSGVFGLMALGILIFLWHHRTNIVMKLAQWQFLCWLMACAMVSYVFTFTFLPTKAWHCRASNILEFIPITMIAAILVGRTWRVFVTVSAAMNIGRNQNESQSKSSYCMRKYYVGCLTWLARFPYNCGNLEDKGNPSGFRQKATAAETTRLILWITSPQIVMQTVGIFFFYDEGLETDFDENITVGLVQCQEKGRWLRAVGLMLVAIAYSAAVVLAWTSRDLPSAFNESNAVFQAAIINSIVGLLAVSLDQLVKSTRTPPNMTTFLWAATSLIVVSTSVGFIVLPKIIRVVSGEEVVVSDLLAQNRTSDDTRRMSRPVSRHSDATKGSIHIGKNDPIPKDIERNLLGVNELLLDVRNELVEGRTPDLQEWQRLIATVEELNENLGRLEFDWTEEDERAR